MLVQDAVVTVAGVGIQGRVGDDPKVRARRLHRRDALRDEPMRVDGLGAIRRFEIVLHVREQRHGRNSQVHAALRVFHQLIDAEPLDPWHRLDRLAPPLAVDDEHRIDEIVDGQRRLAHQATGEVVAAVAPHAGERIAHGRSVHGATNVPARADRAHANVTEGQHRCHVG